MGNLEFLVTLTFIVYQNSNNLNCILNVSKYFHDRWISYTIALNIRFFHSSAEVSRARDFNKAFLDDEEWWEVHPVTTHHGIYGHSVTYCERRPLIAAYGQTQQLAWFVIAVTANGSTIRSNGPESIWIWFPPAGQVKSSIKYPTDIADYTPMDHCQSIGQIWCRANPAPVISRWQKGPPGRVLSTSV